MNDKWLNWAVKIQSIAQAGLTYSRDPYDKERYEELREIAAEMLAERTDIPTGKIRDLFCNESGYQTPKVDTRAAIFKDGKILLVHENNGTWALPGSSGMMWRYRVREEPTAAYMRKGRLPVSCCAERSRKHNS